MADVSVVLTHVKAKCGMLADAGLYEAQYWLNHLIAIYVYVGDSDMSVIDLTCAYHILPICIHV